MRAIIFISSFFMIISAFSQTTPVTFTVQRYKVDEGYKTLAEVFAASDLKLLPQKTNPTNVEDLINISPFWCIITFVHKGLSKNTVAGPITTEYTTNMLKDLPRGTKVYFESIVIKDKSGTEYKIKSITTVR
jgi:hypothetical protein